MQSYDVNAVISLFNRSFSTLFSSHLAVWVRLWMCWER